MVRFAILISATLFAVGELQAQFKESVERNAAILQRLEGSLEGYAETVNGNSIDYSRIRDDRPVALITRATTGKMAIEWMSQRVPLKLKSGETSFVVTAGILTRPNTKFKFQFFVNDVPCLTLSTTDTTWWEAGDSSGVRLTFHGVLRDQYTDAFGYLQIHVPSELLTPGEPVRFKVVGEEAGSSAWFMVFKDPDVSSYLRDRVANEAYCDLSIEQRGGKYEARLSTPTSWTNRGASYIMGEDPTHLLLLKQQNDTVGATFSFDARQSGRFRLAIDDEQILDLPDIFLEINQSTIYPKKLVSIKTRATSPGKWIIEYRSTYAPHLGTSLVELSEVNKGTSNLHFVISTHQDIAWMDSPAQCIRDRDEKILTPTLAIMKEDSNYRFDLEDVLFLREYLERHPDRKDDLRKFIDEGRLGIGAAYNQPYEDLSSGETLVREFYAGRKWLKKNFPGCDTHTYWNVDVPGRTSQMPQILLKAGVKYLFMSRFEKGLYNWISPDGSSVLALSPGHYGDFAEKVGSKDFPEVAGYTASFTRNWSNVIQNGSTNVPLVSMSDMSTPVRYDDFMARWNGLKSISLSDEQIQLLAIPPIHYSSAEGFFNAVSAEKLRLPSINGDRPNIWLYIHGPTHHWAVSAKREADIYLPAAEIFSTIDALLEKSFTQYPQKELTQAWEAQIYPDHGWGGKNGDVTDSTFRAKYEYARDVGKKIYSRATNAIAARIRMVQNKGIPVVVFNNLSWRRTAPVQFTATFAQGAFTRGFTLNDASGRTLSTQLLSLLSYPDGSIKSAEIVFIAEDIPPIGYSTFYIRRSPRTLAPDTTSSTREVLMSRYYRVILGRGGVQQIVDVELHKDLLSTEKFLGAELFTMQSVGQDAGEWSEPQQPTMEGFDKLSNYKPTWRLVESGPVRQVVETQQDIGHATVVQRIVDYNVLKQIDFETSMLKWDGMKYREFRLAFPMKMEKGRVAYETPFATVEAGNDEMKGVAGERYQTGVSKIRPRSIQNWISVSDDEIGVTLSSSVAVWDYQDPTDQPLGFPMLQPVLLASRRSCHGLGPWYLQEGDHSFRFSLTSHRPGWRNSRRFGVGANSPLTVTFNPTWSPKANLPEQRGFFSFGAGNVVLSTIKKCEDDDNVIIRLYEDSGKDVSARFRIAAPIVGAQITNIIEEEGKPTSWKMDEVPISLTHHSIMTLKVLLKK
jgi:alpha-mannosidase